MKPPSLSVDFGLVGVLNRRPSQVYTQLCGCAAAAFTITFVNNKFKRKKIKIRLKFAYSKLGSVSSYVLAVACTNHSLQRFLVEKRFVVCFRS